VGNGVLH